MTITSIPYPDAEALARRRVLVVGDAMLDRYWFGAVDRISPEAPVPVVRVEREEERLGGAANVALNVTRLGARACLMTVVGDDPPARSLQTLLEREGVETILGRDPSLTTIVKLRIIGRSQQLLRADFESPPTNEALLQMLTSFAQALADCDAVLFSDYGKGGLTHIASMIEGARAAGKPVLVDPKGADYSRYAGATVITPNRAELMQVIGRWRDEQDLFERVHRLREELRLEAVLLTRSEEGMTLFDAPQGAASRLDVPAQALDVFDVTGAGDTVIATCAAMLGSGMSLREAVPVANRAGAIVVGKFGTATVSYQELFE
jgi:rfaE bifunctional protein kinase chain/domain